MSKAEPGLFGIIQCPVAETGIGPDDNRQDLEQQQQKRCGGDQEEREALPVSEFAASMIFGLY